MDTLLDASRGPTSCYFSLVLLKTKIRLSKFEDFIGFVESLMKGAASHLVYKRGAPRSLQWKGFIGRNWTKQKLLVKKRERILSVKVPLLFDFRVSS